MGCTMTIPCLTCKRPSECQRDRHCNNPHNIERALRELKAASDAMNAAASRLAEAASGLQAALAIERLKGNL
jgi:hypothetical protein